METDVKLVHIPEAVSRGMEEVWWEVGGWRGRWVDVNVDVDVDAL